MSPGGGHLTLSVDLRRELIGGLRRLRWGRGDRELRLTAEGVRELVHRLEEEKTGLERLTASLEEDFLKLGGSLRKIMSLARDVGERSGVIIEAAAGKTEDAAIQFAFHLLKKAEDLVNASREQHNAVFRVFEKLHVDLAQVARERGSLMRTLFPLDTTNTQFRIQCCAFDEQIRIQFFALADAIKGIVRDVQSAVGQRFEELDRTGKASGELLANLARLSSEQREQTERMLAETRDHLSTLNAALLASEQAANAVSGTGANIAGGASKAIMALQCQDMARQKFQHVGAAIDEINAYLDAGESKGFRGREEADCRHFLADAGRVQLGQLRAVFGQLEQAAEQVQAGLSEIDSEVRILSGQALESGAAALDGQIIDRASASIEAVLGVIENSVDSVRRVVELVGRLKSTFSDCTAQVLGLALRLRMVALNAQIFAAHVEGGTALEVVAKNTRQITDEAMEQLDEMSSRVTLMVGAVEELEQRLKDFSELAAAEQQALAEEAKVSEDKLRRLDTALGTAMKSIDPLRNELAVSVQKTIESIRFVAVVAEAQAHSTRLFEEIAAAGSKPDSVSHHKVEGWKRNYTMAHERTIHESLGQHPEVRETETDVRVMTAGALPAVTPSENEPTGFEEAGTPPPLDTIEVPREELPDNVELF